MKENVNNNVVQDKSLEEIVKENKNLNLQISNLKIKKRAIELLMGYNVIFGCANFAIMAQDYPINALIGALNVTAFGLGLWAHKYQRGTLKSLKGKLFYNKLYKSLKEVEQSTDEIKRTLKID